MDSAGIDHVSDTALWVAWYRAQESQRPDAVFRDPLASKLAGERGRAIAASMPSQQQFAFAMVVRTVAIDRLLEQSIRSGVDMIINLGAGLDTRPYRMNLPSKLRWVEVDHESLIRYKNEQLKGETPVCGVERLACDLARDEDRVGLLRRLGSRTKNALVVTEGLISYLTRDQAARLSGDLLAVPSFRYWIQDYRQGKIRPAGERKLETRLANAPILFDVDNPLRFFGEHGWKIRENLRILDVAESIGRRLPFLFPWSLLGCLLPGLFRRLGNRAYGYVLMEHS